MTLVFALGFVGLGAAALLAPRRYPEDRVFAWATFAAAIGLALLVGAPR